MGGDGVPPPGGNIFGKTTCEKSDPAVLLITAQSPLEPCDTSPCRLTSSSCENTQEHPWQHHEKELFDPSHPEPKHRCRPGLARTSTKRASSQRHVECQRQR